MEVTIDKLAAATGGDPEIIEAILNEGLCTLGEIRSVEGEQLMGVTIKMPITGQPKLMVKSVLSSLQVVMRNLYTESDKHMEEGLNYWMGTPVVSFANLSDLRIMDALVDSEFDGLFKIQRAYFASGVQGGLSPEWLVKRLAKIALERGLISGEEFDEATK